VVSARGLVNRSEPVLPMPALTPDAAAAGALAEDAVLAGSFQLEQFRHPTASIPFLDGAAALVASLDRDVPLLAWMELLGEKFARDFRFDPTATDVSTPLAEVLRLRRGVCQDFAHLYIACARSLGLPAAYVSGYLLTSAAEGSAPLLGADASHAWVQLWCPGTPGVPASGPGAGWLDMDPTNDLVPATGHVRVAVGRDFGDVTPLRGVIRGGGQHTLRVAVTTAETGPLVASS
jgi:transglutaminase-like putative cysteine protease